MLRDSGAKVLLVSEDRPANLDLPANIEVVYPLAADMSPLRRQTCTG